MAARCKALKKDKNEQEAYIVQDALSILSMDNNVESWVIDSGAPFHATSKREVLQNYVAGDFWNVYLGNGESCNIVGKGDVKIKTQGFKWCLKNVKTHFETEKESYFSWAVFFIYFKEGKPAKKIL